MKTASQLISELKSLQAKYGEDFKIDFKVRDNYSHYGQQMSDDFSTNFTGDYLIMTYKLEEQKDYFTNEIKEPKITYRKSK
jgi:hypothetical protein